MCVLMIQSVPVRFAWTGDDDSVGTGHKTKKRRRRKNTRPARTPAQLAKQVKSNLKRAKEQELAALVARFGNVDNGCDMWNWWEGDESLPSTAYSGEREHFTEPNYGLGVTKWNRYHGGSWRNAGRKPKYKDPRCTGHFRVKHIRHGTSGELLAFV